MHLTHRLQQKGQHTHPVTAARTVRRWNNGNHDRCHACRHDQYSSTGTWEGRNKTLINQSYHGTSEQIVRIKLLSSYRFTVCCIHSSSASNPAEVAAAYRRKREGEGTWCREGDERDWLQQTI